MVFPPFSAVEIAKLGLDYRIQNQTDPTGWSKTKIDMALSLGYSKAGLHNLRPSSRACNLALLIHHKDAFTPYILDPKLAKYEELYADGLTEAEGFKPNDSLKARREIAVNKQKARAAKVDKVSQKSYRVESKKTCWGLICKLDSQHFH